MDSIALRPRHGALHGVERVSPNSRTGSSKSGIAAGTLITAAVCLLALPSAVLAFTVRFEPVPGPAGSDGEVGVLQDVDAPEGLARPFPLRSLAKGNPYPFTPAGTPNRPDRSVTVAVRVDAETARAMSVRTAGAHGARTGDAPDLRIAPTGFNLGVSRGYTNFAQNLVNKERKSASELPDLVRFSIAPGAKADDSRFSPRIVLDETQSAGRAPRSFAGDSDDMVDVGGAYRVTKNLDVTAGVRYSQERERLVPVTDGKQDNQAIYLGTQFRF